MSNQIDPDLGQPDDLRHVRHARRLMSNQIDPDLGQAIIGSVVNNWLNPEIRRRRAAGLLPENFLFYAAQIIFDLESSSPEVRLNGEVRAVAKLRSMRDGWSPGDPIQPDDVVAVEAVELTEHDPNAGHITILPTHGGWLCGFDLRYNAARIEEILEAAPEYIETAASALERGHLRPFVENLWSAVELMAKGLIYQWSDRRAITSKKHGFVSSEFNRLRHIGLANDSWANLLNRLNDLRPPARYLGQSLNLAPSEASVLLADARAMFGAIEASAPARRLAKRAQGIGEEERVEKSSTKAGDATRPAREVRGECPSNAAGRFPEVLVIKEVRDLQGSQYNP